jgi:hypothetical protein
LQCVAAAAGELVLRGAGASGSFLESIVKHPGTEEYKKSHPDLAFKVTCVTLWDLLALHKIKASTTFIKIDTEGAEWSIVPSLHTWLAGMTKKPTFAISLHRNNEDIVQNVLPEFLAVLRLFKYGFCWPPPEGAGDIAFAMKTLSTNLTQESFLACHRTNGDWLASDM